MTDSSTSLFSEEQSPLPMGIDGQKRCRVRNENEMKIDQLTTTIDTV